MINHWLTQFLHNKRLDTLFYINMKNSHLVEYVDWWPASDVQRPNTSIDPPMKRSRRESGLENKGLMRTLLACWNNFCSFTHHKLLNKTHLKYAVVVLFVCGCLHLGVFIPLHHILPAAVGEEQVRREGVWEPLAHCHQQLWKTQRAVLQSLHCSSH